MATPVRSLLCAALPAVAVLFAGSAFGDGPGTREIALDPRSFKIISSESGSVDYYAVVGSGSGSYIHAAYRPPFDTAVLGYEIPERLRRSVARFRWKWRAIVLPRGGDECTPGKTDSAAVVYVTWKRGLKWYSIKYVYSAVGKKGQTCDRRNNLFRAQDTVVVDSGPPLGEWRTVDIDPDLEFRRHFENGDPRADVPNLVGVAIMSDGDQTKSDSVADYGGFSLMVR